MIFASSCNAMPKLFAITIGYISIQRTAVSRATSFTLIRMEMIVIGLTIENL